MLIGTTDADDRIRRALLERAGRRIRTDDLLITNQLLYQLSYAGKMRVKVAYPDSLNKRTSLET